MKKYITGLVAVAFLGCASVVSAHVVVKPNQVGIAAFQTFTMGVPNEKDTPTIAVRLLIPAGLHEVSPTVKPGWNINVISSGTGDDTVVSEIDWTGGSIPVGERDDFTFSAQVPATPSTLEWKAYQTYQGGTVVSWDQDPQVSMDDVNNLGPYSKTAVINDLGASSTGTPVTSSSESAALDLSIVSIIVSVIAIVLSRKN